MPRAAALALLVVSATGCSSEALDEWSRGGMPVNITEQAEVVQNLWNGSWIAAIATGVVVMALILWACLFHRKKKNSKEELPPQVRYNLPIEILYTVVPIVMVSVFFYFTARDQNYLGEFSKSPDVKVKVEAFQWSWRFTTDYQGKKAEVVGVPVSDYDKGPQLVLPVNKKVLFELHSPDVIHSFWVPSFLFKRDVIPGNINKNNKFEITTLNKPGIYAGRCAELCGTDHSRMLFSVKLVPQAEYDAYIAGQAGRTQ
ncbi:putative cytochrome c oxidase subunit 2 [Sinosporangium siamense]|uniref:cytochrome-c oxidase n=1 Tax=Sinosporangium siamense TaxID=1367973 RepID=A0A919RCC9_9ACTN|nr:putative cytochrome c oxidase subunit 2 [Sinosporangium siamense]